MSTAGGWDFYLGESEATGYVTGDVAQTWNDHAARSDLHLDDAADAIESGNDALHDAAAAIGTDPAAFDAAMAQATASFEASYDNQLASLGLGAGSQQAGADDAEWGADAFDLGHDDSQVDGF